MVFSKIVKFVLRLKLLIQYFPTHTQLSLQQGNLGCMIPPLHSSKMVFPSYNNGVMGEDCHMKLTSCRNVNFDKNLNGSTKNQSTTGLSDSKIKLRGVI